MMAIRPERLGADRLDADKFGSGKSGPEKFAPDRRAPERPGPDPFGAGKIAEKFKPEKLSDIGQAAAAAVEGEIREFVRRDVAQVRRPRNDADGTGDPVADNLNALIRRVSGASMDEIDRVISDLQGVRDMLRQEGDRVSREVAGYASLSHAAMTAMSVIADSLTQWKSAPGPLEQRADSQRTPAQRSAG